MGKQLPMVIKNIHEITPFNAKRFEKEYSKLQKFDFVYIDANSEVTFSRKVVKDGATIVTPIPTDRERLRATLRSEAQMRERYQDREPVYEERLGREQPLQTTQPSYGEQIRGDSSFTSSAVPVSRTESSYTTVVPANPFVESRQYSPVPSVPAQPAAQREQSPPPPAPQSDRGIFHGLFGGSSGAPIPGGDATRTYESTGSRAPIRSSFF